MALKDNLTRYVSLKSLIEHAQELLKVETKYKNPQYERALVNLITDAAVLPHSSEWEVAEALGLDNDVLSEACEC